MFHLTLNLKDYKESYSYLLPFKKLG